MNTQTAATTSQRNSTRAKLVGRQLSECLGELDAIDEGRAAAHVSMAIDLLKKSYSTEA